jgi:uncharacterized protein (TIGR02265 family)
MSVGDDWGHAPVSAAQADAYASRIPGITPAERGIIARDFELFPAACQVRGVFFEGLSRVVAKQGGITMAELFTRAGVSPRKIPFSLYPHRDFYRLYFLAARALHPRLTLPAGLSQVARTFYPIFRESMVGKTMSAFIGDDPPTLLERLSQAYSLSIPWNEHRVERTGASEVTWRCKVEPSSFYKDVFTGIVTGTTESHGTMALRVTADTFRIEGDCGRHVFKIRW